MKKILFKIFGAFFVLLMMTGVTIFPALASDPVSYLEWTESGFVTKTVSEYTMVSSETDTWTSGTYAVQGAVTINSGIQVQSESTVNLILCDNAALTTEGVTISSNASLKIYGQSGGSGKLVSTGVKGKDQEGDENAQPGKIGINAIGQLTLHGGQIHATGGAGGNSHYSDSSTNASGINQGGTGGTGIQSYGKLTVYGGKLIATGGAGGRGSQNTVPEGANGIQGKAITGDFIIGNDIIVQADGGNGDISQPGTYSGKWTHVTLECISSHTHSWSIAVDSSNSNMASVRCTSANCPYENNGAFTATIQASGQTKVYDGQPVTASVTTSDGFPEDITVSAITYTGLEDTDYPCSSSPPSNVGNYSAAATVSDGIEGTSVQISVPFKITAKTLSWAVTDAMYTYDGMAHGLQISVTDPSSGAEIRYKDAEGQYTLQTCPSITDVSDSPITVHFQITAANYETVTGSAKIIVNPAATLNESALSTDQQPSACSLTYDGTAQDLLSAPIETVPAGYTLQYSAGDSNWSTEIPTGKDAGEYTVRYKYAGDANHSDYPAEGSLEITGITIAPKEVSLNWNQTELIYNGEPQVPSAVAGGLCGSDECTVTVTGAQTSAGTYTATATGLSNGNYQLPEAATQEFTISPREVSSPVITLEYSEKEYTSSALEPAVLSVMDGSTVIDPEEYIVSYRDNTYAGTASVIISDTDGGNYTVSGSTTFTITKKKAVVTVAPSGVSETYTGQPIGLGAAGTADGGTLQYGLTPASAADATCSWSDQIPSATEANEYKLWYYIKADDNHEDSDPAFVQTKISPKAITISGITAVSKDYDGTAAATLNYAGIDWIACGRVGDDDLSVTATGTFSQPDTGTGLTVTLSGMTLTGAKAGNYVLDATESQTTATADIRKAASSVKTAPQAKILTGNGIAQELITAGEVSGGQILYALGENYQTIPAEELFTDQIPTATEEGIYHVWYKCKGDSNHTDTEAACLSVTVEAPPLDPNPEPEHDPEPQQPDPEPNPEPDPEPQQEPDPQPDSEPIVNPVPDAEPLVPAEQPASPSEQEPPAQSDPQLLPDSEQEQPSELPASPTEQETPTQSDPQPLPDPQQEQPSELPASPTEQETPTQSDPQPLPDSQQEQPSELPASPTEQETPTQSDPQPLPDSQQEQPSELPASPTEQETPTRPDSQPQPEPQLPVEQPVSPPVQEILPEPQIPLPEEPAVPQPEQIEMPTLPEQPSESEQLPTAAASVSGGKYSIDEGKKTAVYTGSEDAAASSVTIPAAISVDGVSYPVTEIQAKAFQGMTELRQITIGRNISVIGQNAFSGCSALKKVVFKGKNVVTIGNSAFRKCTALTSMTIPAGVQNIGKRAFEGCKKLKTINIKTQTLSTVGKKAFKGISAKAKFKCPKMLLDSYTEMIRNAGAPKKAMFIQK